MFSNGHGKKIIFVIEVAILTVLIFIGMVVCYNYFPHILEGTPIP